MFVDCGFFVEEGGNDMWCGWMLDEILVLGVCILCFKVMKVREKPGRWIEWLQRRAMGWLVAMVGQKDGRTEQTQTAPLHDDAEPAGGT